MGAASVEEIEGTARISARQIKVATIMVWSGISRDSVSLSRNLRRCAADNKNLTGLGALPVMITASTMDRLVTTRDLLYRVEKLTCMLLS